MIEIIIICILSIICIFLGYDLIQSKTENAKKEMQISEREKILIKNESGLSLLESQLQRKYENKINEVASFLKGKERKGFYSSSFFQTIVDEKITIDVDIHVIEIDRYTNGKSKIKIEHINITSIKGPNRKLDEANLMSYIKKTFKELVDTTTIEWLESVNEIQKEREKKLERINKLNGEN